LIEILWSVSIALLAFDGEEWNIYGPIELNLIDGAYPYCSSRTACSFLEQNEIFININRFDRRDACDRDPLQHEVLHHIYDQQKIEVHGNCNLSAPYILLQYSN